MPKFKTYQELLAFVREVQIEKLFSKMFICYVGDLILTGTSTHDIRAELEGYLSGNNQHLFV